MGSKQILIVLTTLAFVTQVLSVDLWSAREQPCFTVKDTVPIDGNWVGSVETWYNPRMSRYDLYSLASDLLAVNPSDVEEGAMYYDSCITFKFLANGSLISQGYNGRSKEYLTEAIKSDFQITRMFPKDGNGFDVTFYATLTDNKSFIFFPECTKDGVMAWCVLTPMPSLPEETWQKIRRHAVGLGFKEEFFTELRYDYCQKPSYPPGNTGWGSGVHVHTYRGN